MYVRTKGLALSAVCLALSMLIIMFESVLGISTLFLLSFAAFLIGIVIREVGLKAGVAYFFSSVFLSLILAPNKLKLPVYFGVEFYLLVREFTWMFLEKRSDLSLKKRRFLYFTAKFLTFNGMLIPFVFLLPELIMPNMTLEWKLAAIVMGEAIWYFFDMAYNHFQSVLWDRMKYRK